MRATRAGLVAGSVLVMLCAAVADATGHASSGAAPAMEVTLRRLAIGLCGVCTYLWVFGPRMFRCDRRPGGAWNVRFGWIVAFGAVVAGIAGAALLFADALDMVLASSRLLGGDPAWRDAGLAREGLYEAGSLAAAGVVGLAGRRERTLVTAVFWLLILAGWWGVLAVASGAWQVLAGLMVVVATVLGGFTIAQGLIRRHRRTQAWPDHLSQLIEGYPDWPGFRSGAVVAALAVLLFGCATLTSPWTAPSAAAAGAAAFGLTHREWSPNLARLGVALATIAVVAVPLPWFAGDSGQELAALMPVLLNVALFALAWMTFYWYWLASVWDQQRLDGRAWTTAGRLIPVAHRAGFFSGAFGLLVAIQMSGWPRTLVASTRDDSVGRWIAGLAGIGALSGALMIAAVITQKRALIGLMVVSVCVGGLFIAVRLGVLFGQGVW